MLAASEAAAGSGRSQSRGPTRYVTQREHVWRTRQRRHDPDSKRGAGDGSLQGNRQHTPEAARPALGCSGAQGWWGALDTSQGRVRRNCWHSSLQRTPASAARTILVAEAFGGSTPGSARFCAGAATRATPSRASAAGTGRPARVRGETSVASQHKASPLLVAP